MRQHIVAIIVATLIQLPGLQVLLGTDYRLQLYGVVLGALAIMALVHVQLVSRIWRILPYIMLTTMLCGLLLLSISWTLSRSQWRTDAELVMFILALVFLLPWVLSHHVVRLSFYYTVVYALGFAGFALWASKFFAFGTVTGYESEAITGSYLTLAAAIAYGFMYAVAHICFARRLNWLWFIPAFLLGGGVAVSLSRGALIFSGLAILGYGLWGWQLRPMARLVLRLYALRRYALFLLPLLALALTMALQVERTKERLHRMLNIGWELQEGGRGKLWSTAWTSIVTNPVAGYGLGSHGTFSGTSEALYPHNMLLEVWLDAGILAVLLLITIIVYPLIKVWRELWYDPPSPALMGTVACYGFAILEFSKSGSVYTGRALFIFGLMLMATTTPELYLRRISPRGRVFVNSKEK